MSGMFASSLAASSLLAQPIRPELGASSNNALDTHSSVPRGNTMDSITQGEIRQCKDKGVLLFGWGEKRGQKSFFDSAPRYLLRFFVLTRTHLQYFIDQEQYQLKSVQGSIPLESIIHITQDDRHVQDCNVDDVAAEEWDLSETQGAMRTLAIVVHDRVYQLRFLSPILAHHWKTAILAATPGKPMGGETLALGFMMRAETGIVKSGATRRLMVVQGQHLLSFDGYDAWQAWSQAAHESSRCSPEQLVAPTLANGAQCRLVEAIPMATVDEVEKGNPENEGFPITIRTRTRRQSTAGITITIKNNSNSSNPSAVPPPASYTLLADSEQQQETWINVLTTLRNSLTWPKPLAALKKDGGE